MSYQVALLNFEGPLDLLLQLIERSELEVTAISLAEVTEQYLGYLGEMDKPGALELNWFIDVASKLIYIKSQALLPASNQQEAESDTLELTEQLQRYQAYKHASRRLEQLLRRGDSSWQRPIRAELSPEAIPPPNLDLAVLSELFDRAIAKLPAREEAVIEQRITLGDMTARLTAGLTAGRTRMSDALADCRTRMEVVVLFLAVLELLKAGEVSVSQDKQFDDMIIASVA